MNNWIALDLEYANKTDKSLVITGTDGYGGEDPAEVATNSTEPHSKICAPNTGNLFV